MAGYDDIVAQMKEDQSSITPSPYDDVAKQIRQQAEASRAQAAISVGSSINSNPDRAGMNRAIAKKYNTTPEVVDHYPDEFRQRMSVELARDALKQAPKLEQSINADPTIAQVMHDDVPNTAALETVMTEWKPSIGERLHAWINDAFNVPQREQARAMNTYAAKKAGLDGGQARDAVGGMSEILGQFGSKLYNVGSFGLIPDVEGDATTTAGSLAGGGGSLAGFVMGGPVKTADYMLGKLGIHSLENVAGQSFAKGLAKDIVKGAATLGTATALGDIGNAINSPDLLTAGKKEVKSFASGAETGAVFGTASRLFPDSNIPSFLARAATTSLALDELNGTSPLDTYNKWDSLSSQEKVDRVFNYGLNTLFSAHGAGRTNGGWFHDAAKADLAAEDYNKMQTLGTLAAASKWRERDQEGFKKYVASVTEDSNLPHVFIDGKTFAQTLNEAGVTDQELARTMPDVAKQLNEALQTDGYLKISTADYLTHIAGGPLDAKILEHLKTDPEGKTYKEAQDFMEHQNQQLREMASKIAEDKSSNEDFNRSRQAVYDDLMKQLKDTGRYTPDAAKAYATLHRDFSTVMADRLNMTPEEYHQQYGAKIVSSGTGKFDQEENNKQTVVIDKSRLGEDHQDIKSLKKSAYDYALKNFGHTIIKNKSDSNDIIIAKTGLKKAVSGYDSNLTAHLFSHLDELVSKAEFVKSVADEKARGAIKEIRYYDVPVSFDGETKNVRMVVRVDNSGHRYYDHFEWGNEKSPADDSSEVGFRQSSIQTDTGLSETDIASLKRLNPESNSDQVLNQSPFYSALSRAFENVKQSSMPADQWAKWLDGNASKLGVKKDEIEWTGIKDYLALKGKDKLSKDEITEYLANNGVKVEEVMLGETDVSDSEIQAFLDDEAGQGLSWEEARNYLKNDQDHIDTDAKYAQYQLPGGKNYRELLLTLPDPTSENNKRMDQIQEELGNSDLTDEERDTLRKEYRDLSDVIRASGAFQSNHWDQGNILAHVRFNERTDADGNRVLFIEELQSDWGQQGKKKGFQIKDLAKLEARRRELESIGGQLRNEGKEIPSEIKQEWADIMNKIKPDNRDYEGNTGYMGGKVPNGPFVTDTKAWTALAVKRMTRYAVDNGFDKVAFVNGEQSADRYDLSKQLDKVIIRKYADEWAVEGYKGNTETVNRTAKTDADLADVIGKELADKAIKDNGGVYEGVDLKVGGEGMKAFYDNIVPSVVNDVLRKTGGGKLESVAKENTNSFEIYKKELIEKYGSDYKKKASEEEFDKLNSLRLARSEDQVYTRYFDITPAMRDEILKGQALFQGEDAARGFFNPESKTIGLLKDADLSTFLHETGHFFLDTYAKTAELHPEIKKDMDVLLKWFGVDSLEKWNSLSIDEQRESHEKFARGFEAYLMEGKAPSLELQTIFSRFRSWLLNVYKSLTNLNVELTPEVKGVMDRMLASEETIKNAEVARGFTSLFTEKPESMSDEEWQQYNDLATQATDQAISDIQSKSIRDMKWLTGARNKAIKAAQDKAAALRREVRVEVRSDVLKTPVYQAWQFLTGHDEQKAGVPPKEKVNKSLDPSRDSLFTAIAKLGGLDADAVKSEFGFDPADMKQHVPLFGKPVFRKKDGRSVDAMAEDIAQHGYLSLDEHGKYDLHEFEERLEDELAGHEHFSYAKDYSELNDFGQTADDIRDLPAGRLNLSMARALDKEGAAKLEELRMTREGALDPDIVADMFGFGSGRELIQTIAAAENPKTLIERLTDQRLLERHGELASPSGIERAAEAAIHNGARARFVATGLKILTKSPISSRLILRGAKEAAEGAVAAKKVRDVDPKQYSAAELKANKEALKLVAKDPAGAAKAQRSSLLNNQLVTASEKALADVKAGLDYFKKMNKPSVRKNIDVAFRDQIDQLLSRYDLRSSLTPEQATGKSIASLESFVEKLAAMKFSIEVPEDLIINANKMHYKDMTVEQFRGLIDAVKSIEKLGREVQKITDGDKQRDINEVALEATQQLENMPKKKADTNRGLSRISSKWVGAKKMVRSVTASLLKTEQMVDWLDQYNPNGVFNRMVFRKIADAEGVRNDLDLKISQKWEEHVAALPSDLLKNNRGSVEIPGVIDGITGENQRLTWGEKIALAGIRGDAGHFAKLLKGEGWDTNAVLDFLDNNMTKEEWDFVKGLADTFQELYPMKEAMMRSLGASAPKEVDRIPFQTIHGEQSGWYWPITYDPARSRSVKERYAKHEASLFEDNIYTRADTSTGRENTRNDNYAKPMLLSIDVLPRILKDEIRDITTRKAIIEADRFLSHPDVRRSIINTLSEDHYDLFNGWLLSIANDAMVKPSELQMWDRVAHEIRTRTTMVGLGFRVSTMLMHGLTAAGESIAEAGPKAIAKGVFNKKTWAALTTIGPEFMQKGLDSFMRDTQFASNRDFIFERSAEMRHRSNEIERDVREKLREIHVQLMDPATGSIERAKLAITSRAYQGICMLDMASALPTWMGAYLKGMESKEKGGFGMSEDDAVYYADKTVRNAHGGGGVKDIAAVQRGGEWFKLFTMFYTFWNHNINRIIDTGKRIKELPQGYQEAKATGDFSGFRGDVGTLILRSFMYTLGVQAIHHMINPPKEEDGEEGWIKWFSKQMVMSVAGGVPLARDVAGHYAGGKDYEMSPVASIVRSTDMFVKDAEGTSKSDRFIKHALTEAGYVFGLPLGQPGSTIQFLSDVWDGKQHPQDMAQWWRGLTSGDMNH